MEKSEHINPFSSLQRSGRLGTVIIYEPELSSTNTLALELIKNDVENGAVVITDLQTDGRGRGGSTWEAVRAKGLTFSLILYPHLPATYGNYISLLTGIAIASTLKKFHIDAQLKWPNDVLVSGKKLGGILCESHIRNHRIESLVIGIGLNVNENADNFSPQLNKTATSMNLETSKEFDRAEVLSKLLKELDHWLDIWTAGDTKEILAKWMQHCSHIEQPVKFKSGAAWAEGIFKGVTDHGEAILDTGSGSIVYSGSDLTIL